MTRGLVLYLPCHFCSAKSFYDLRLIRVMYPEKCLHRYESHGCTSNCFSACRRITGIIIRIFLYLYRTHQLDINFGLASTYRADIVHICLFSMLVLIEFANICASICEPCNSNFSKPDLVFSIYNRTQEFSGLRVTATLKFFREWRLFTCNNRAGSVLST